MRRTDYTREDVMVMPNATGHVFANDGCLLRVDIIAGQWVASRYGPNLVVKQRVIGTNDAVHRQIKQWW
jgi:hypothetical protein